MLLTICGSGNGAHALAVVASQNIDGEISWLVGSEEKADRLRRGLSTAGLRSTGAITAAAHRVGTVSADPAEVIPNADMVVIVVPAFGHAAVLRRIEPYISETTTIGCMPTRGGFEFDMVKVAPSRESAAPEIFGLQTLPWSTRVTTLGEVVNIGAVKAKVFLAALPSGQAPGLAARLSELLGTEIVAAESFLSLTLGNPGQFIHPGLMYGHYRSWQGEEFSEEDIPMFYAQATDEMGEIVDLLSREALAVALEIEAGSEGALNLRDAVVPTHAWLKSTYGHVTGDTTTVATCFRTGPIQARKAPARESQPGRFVPDFDYRYLTEDVPFGLVATRALAELAGVQTPTIDEVITWAQAVLSKRYLVDAGLQGSDIQDLPIPQNHGIATLPDLVAWYSDAALTRARP
jgi:hypothetical protein